MLVSINNRDSESCLTTIQMRTSDCIELYVEFYNKVEIFLEKCSPVGSNDLEQLGLKDTKKLIIEKYKSVASSIDNIISKFDSFNSTFNEVTAEEVFKHHFIHFIEQLIKLERTIRFFDDKVHDHLSNSTEVKDMNEDEQIYMSNIVSKTIDELKEINSLIMNLFEGIATNSHVISNEINNRIITLKNIENINFENRFREQTELLVKGYEHEVRNLTESFKNQIKNLKLDQEDTLKSNELLKKNSDLGLKKLAELNEKTQNIELEYSKIIKTESGRIQREIEDAKGNIAEDINTLFNGVNSQINAIKTTHADLLGIVEKAGIYELTKNYKEKAGEEKIEYKEYRKFTALSIIAAIVSTIIVFIVAFVEHYFAATDAPTNYLLLASRLSISLMFFVLALYLSKQASKHYECYQENHRTFLQLAALEPFMARMTPEEQKEIRKGLIPSYFNQANDGKYASKGDEVDFSTNTTSIINNLIDKLGTKKEEASPPRNENPTG